MITTERDRILIGPDFCTGANVEETPTVKEAHMHTIHNREEVEGSLFCYCICCQTLFKPEEIDDYADGGATAVCPYCDCDAVLGDACGIKLTDELLERLHNKFDL